MKIPIDKIIIGERQRTDLGSLDDLDSMSDPEVGQLNPLILDKDNRLIAGRRRLAKATLLGWTEIRAEYHDATTEIAKQKVEYFEDIGRRDRSWSEKCTAVYKLHRLMVNERAVDGEEWTLKQTSVFSGIGLTNVKYMTQVGAAIIAEPEGDVAKAEGFVAAYKVLVGKKKDVIVAEMEKRRQRLNAVELAEAPSHDNPYGRIEPEVPVDNRPEPSIEIHLRGYNKLFGKTTAQYSLAILVKPEVEMLPDLLENLTPNGIAVLWIRHPGMFEMWKAEAENTGFYVMPFPLIWADPLWSGKSKALPFKMDYGIGIVLHNSKPIGDYSFQPSSFISAPAEGNGNVPLAVISHTLNLSLDGDAVLLPCGVDPVMVATCGRVPVFFEPDLVKFKEQMDALELYYIDNVPNAKVIR